MTNPPLNSQTDRLITSYLNSPSQSLGLIGPRWLNKSQISRSISMELLGLDDHGLTNYPYILNINDPDAKSIGIDEIRRINGFIKLKVPINRNVNRIVLIERANSMTIEAQNALLKALEEPPTGTLFILNSTSLNELLPTIVSRLQLVSVLKPTKSSLVAHYEALGHDKSEIDQAYLISGGLPGLMDLMLGADEHPLNAAVTQARQLLSATTFDRLNSVNQLAKDKDQLKNVLFIIKQMSKIGLSSVDGVSARRWQKILAACLDSEAKLDANGQTKLLLTNFMLSIA